MTSLILEYPVHTPDNRILFPAGETLSIDKGTHTTGVINGFHFKEEVETVPVGCFGNLENDIFRFIDEKKAYSVIFQNLGRKAVVADMMRSTSVPLPVFKILERFKKELPYYYKHTLLVFSLSAVLGSRLLKKPEEKKRLALAAFSFDVGMISIPKEILNKKTPLTEGEQKQLEHHTMAGYLLLKEFLGNDNNYPAFAALNHHERLNGRGYPAGISVIDPISAVITTADIFDALTSERPFRPDPFDVRAALDVLIEYADRGELDFKTVQTLVSENRASKPKLEQCLVSMEKRGTPPEKNAYGLRA